MTSAWTWRQYGVYRVLLGVYLFVHFATLLPWGGELFSSKGMVPVADHSPLIAVFPNLLGLIDSSATVFALLLSGACAAALLTIGQWDRVAALWMWFLLACLFGRNPLIANPSLPVVGWLLLFHALLPDRREEWEPDLAGTASTIPRGYMIAAWGLLAVAYSFSGWTKLFSDAWMAGETVRWVLENPLARDTWLRVVLLGTPPWMLEAVTIGILWIELLFAPLVLVRRLRPWLWLGMLFVQFGFLTLLNFADLTTPMLLLHLLTFDSRWLPARREAGSRRLYYDGECGLCHAWVGFVLAEDHADVYRFIPLQGDVGQRELKDVVSKADFDSMYVVTPDGRRLGKMAAALEILLSLDGLWQLAGALAWLVPTRLGDRVYDAIARRRKAFITRPDGLCPVLPPNLRLRFET